MALSITVNGGGTFSASMEEGPVSFTASLGAVPGPKGDTGATGPAGVVAATAPIVYTIGTQTVSMDTAYFVRSPAVAGTDTQILSWDAGTTRPLWIDNQTRALFMLGTNKTGTTIAKGKAVYVSGATGNHPEITLAQANSELSSSRTIGITAEAIANNAEGRVIVAGRLENVDTNGFAAGDTLYLSTSSAGGFTTTFPTQPNHGVLLGYVTRANANTGVIEVRVDNYQELGEQSDVLLTSKTNNDLLAYESSSGLWKNKSFSTLGLALSSDLSAYLLSSTAASTYALLASPTFTGTVTIPAGASITGYLTTSTAASTYAPLASPTFTGDPKAPTPATSDNDTSIATTAFVNAYAPAASTTTSGKVELATDAEALAGTDTSRAITPASLQEVFFDEDRFEFNSNGWTASTSGTGAATTQNFQAKKPDAPTSAVGYGILYSGLYAINRGQSANSGASWGRRYVLSFRVLNVGTNIDSNSIGRVIFGKGSAVTTPGLSTRGFGIEFAIGGTLKVLAHDGTTLTTYNTSHTVAAATAIDVKLVLASNGTVECFVNGSSVGSTTGGPTSGVTSAGNSIHLEAENIATLTNNRLQLLVQNIRLIKAV